jgi:hypothetical protein
VPILLSYGDFALFIKPLVPFGLSSFESSQNSGHHRNIVRHETHQACTGLLTIIPTPEGGRKGGAPVPLWRFGSDEARTIDHSVDERAISDP